MSCYTPNIFKQDFGEVKLVISRGPTDMNSDQVMTANAVREYVEEKVESTNINSSQISDRIYKRRY